MTHYDVIKNWIEKKASVFEISTGEVEEALSTFSRWPGQKQMTAGTAGRRFRDVKASEDKMREVGIDSIEEVRKERGMSVWKITRAKKALT